ncbi:MAG: HAD-IIIC family phosphatase [Pseudomonadota bacterium]
MGEDGIEGVEIGGAYPGSAYRAFQDTLRGLSQRGIALAVASKNDEDLALEMMAQHPEMVLRPGDLVAHRIGWTEKAPGIQAMLDEIGLGAQSCMFIDDNPVEREKVRRNIPGCIVPPFPDAPEDLAGWLAGSPFLECIELTGSDLKRTQQYQVRAQVNAARRAFQDIDEFYHDLDMRLSFEPFGPGNQKRVLQLFAKTNQFNATLRRHDAGAVQQILDDGGELYAVGVADRHSAYELMGVIALRPGARMAAAYPDDPAVQTAAEQGTLWVDSFLLSCRILGRTVEDAIVAWASGRAADCGATALIGQIIEAPRNTPVRGVFAKSGMAPVDSDLDLGKGGLFRHDLSDGPLPIPDYFTIGEPPEGAPAPPRATGSRPAAASRANGSTAAGPVAPPAAAAMHTGPVMLDPATEARLADTFRGLFQIDAAADLSGASRETVERWDSLGHLKLAMEIDQHLGIRIAGTRFGMVTSYADLRAAVAEQL